MQPCGMITWKNWKVSLKQTIFQSSQKLFQIYPATYYRNTSYLFWYSILSMSRVCCPSSITQLSCTEWQLAQGQENSSVCPLNYGERFGEKWKELHISRFRFAWRLLTPLWFEQVMSWLWWQGEAACTWR